MAGESTRENCGNRDGEVAGKSQRKVGLIYDETMCKHDTPDGEDHYECPDRIRVIWQKFQLAGVAQRCVLLDSSKAQEKHLQLVHTKDHVNLVKSISTKQKDSRRNKIASRLNSIYLNGGSSEAAYLAAGSVVEVAEKVAEGALDCGFAIVRPPGHHAEAGEAMGFCLFNNVAVAASYLLNERPDLGVKKILIVDWDVHHGNGTQKMFWEDPRVLFFSVHRHDHGRFYPTGDDGDYNMVGEGPGEGFNINIPWEQGGCGDADYFAAWNHILIPVTKEFNPDIILLSAGFDAAIGDPLGGCCVTPYGYSVMLKKLMGFAQGKMVLALEGGYNLESMAKSSLACVQVLLEDKSIQCSSGAYPLESTRRVIQAVRKRLSTYWPSLADEISWKLIDQKTPTPANLIFDHLTQENRELGYKFCVAYDALMASNENLKNLSTERNSSLLREVEELKSLLAARDGSLEAKRKELEAKKNELEAKDKLLEARLMLVRTREDEIRSLGAKIESLLRERDEAEAKAGRLDKELQEDRSRSRPEIEDMDSEDLEPIELMRIIQNSIKEMKFLLGEMVKEKNLSVIGACVTTRYQVCREWERHGTLACELELAAEEYHRYREFLDKHGKRNGYPSIEEYEERWKALGVHRPL